MGVASLATVDLGDLRPPGSLGADVLWRQFVTASWSGPEGEESSRSFEAVVQTEGESLLVLGLDPTGRIGFSIQYDGTAVDLENNLPDVFPFDPRLVLLDVQRAYFPWIDGEEGVLSAARSLSASGGGELMAQTCSADGRLARRVFRRADGNGPTAESVGEIRVDYRWAEGDGDVPTETRLENDRLGYRLVIETLSAERFDVEPNSGAGSTGGAQ